MMTKLGFTFYPQDWWSSDTFYDFDVFERYVYLECLFLMYRNNGYMKTQKTQFENRVRISVNDETWAKVTSKFIETDQGFTSLTVNKRLNKAVVSRQNGKLGGRPKKYNNPENPDIKPKEKEKEKENINESSQKQIILGTGEKYFIVKSDLLHSQKYRVQGVDGLREFMELNESILDHPDQHAKFMRDVNGDKFNDLMHVRNTFKKFIQKQYA